MSTPSSLRDFNSLSLKDLIEARDMFHVHLTNKRNVIATAIGRYLIRLIDLDDRGYYHPREYKPHEEKPKRTLDNSMVTNLSWPCILVYVSQWEEKSKILDRDVSDLIPKSLFMPDGRIVPICIVEVSKSSETEVYVDPSELQFPENLIGGGFPAFVDLQGRRNVATLGCIVSDGHKYYALTNKHVVGEEGIAVQSVFGGKVLPVGKSSGRNLGKLPFTHLYPGFKGSQVAVNCDAGLIDIANINYWKTEILSVGEMDEMYDINTMSLSLTLLAEHALKDGQIQPSKRGNVVAYGAYSRKMEGEIAALFYRYKSLGGIEYVSDFLIAGRNNHPLTVHHGDSGAVWHLSVHEEGRTKIMPIALHWGQHDMMTGKINVTYTYSLSTCLSNICRELDVEIIRGWNVDHDYSWGKTGHYKIAARACDIVTNKKLKNLLQLNKLNISFSDEGMEAGDMKTYQSGTFCALADVADLVWRTKRKLDASNHFADMDESHPKVRGGKTLFDLCANPKNVHVDFWNDYYAEFEIADPEHHDKNKRGALPFRIWQAFNLMVEYLQQGDLAEFVCVGGIVSHYLGDACQPLHGSYLHHGHNEDEADVHSDFETEMLDRFMLELIQGVNRKTSRKRTFHTYSTGHEAAVTSVKLMKKVASQILSPQEILDVFNETGSRGRIDHLWAELGDRAIACVSEGAINLALFWESAWAAGKGDAIYEESDLFEVNPDYLMELYLDKEFFPSYKLSDPAFKSVCV